MYRECSYKNLNSYTEENNPVKTTCRPYKYSLRAGIESSTFSIQNLNTDTQTVAKFKCL